MVQSGHRSKRLKTKENAKTPPLTGLFSVIHSVYIKLFTLTAVKSWIINHTYKCLEARLIHWGFLNKQEPAQLTINYQTCLYKNHYTLFLLTAQFIFSHGCSHLLRESTKITKKKKKCRLYLQMLCLTSPRLGKKCPPTSTWMPRLMKGKQPYTYAHLASAKTD